MQTIKSILVTGATTNSGLAIAEKFLSNGWAVFITSRDGEKANKKALELQEKYNVPCFGYSFDPRNAKVETEGLFNRIAEEGYTLDCVVCNAANLGLNQDALTVDLQDWEDVILTNIMGYFVPARYAAKKMVEAGKSHTGTVVFIGSINYRDAIPGRSAYVATKGAIRSLTKALALDFAPYGIRVNCVMPGPIWTTRYDEDPAKGARKAAAVPLKRVTTTAEIANVVWFFATEQSGNTTGAGLIIDGGLDCVVNGAY